MMFPSVSKRGGSVSPISSDLARSSMTLASAQDMMQLGWFRLKVLQAAFLDYVSYISFKAVSVMLH